MAKDVDLSSKEWRDIVFENKNKDFGAYILRAGSVQRHTKALIITVVILAALLVVGILATAGILFNKAEEDINAGIGQEEDDHKVYSLANVEQKPTFPGGDAAMFKWLGEHINYPAAAAEEGASGKVQVQFVVSKTGKVTNVTVVRGKHPALDKEAIRVVSAMPNWTPGRQNGQPVNVTYILPVNFTLK